jgi:regulator of chromosome condensation
MDDASPRSKVSVVRPYASCVSFTSPLFVFVTSDYGPLNWDCHYFLLFELPFFPLIWHGQATRSTHMTARVFVWGSGSGLGVPLDKEGVCPFPARVERLPANLSFTQVACGDSFVMALDEHGAVWSWGINRGGRLGHDGEDGIPTVVREGLEGCVCISIAAGQSHLLAVAQKGNTDSGVDCVVMAWGNAFHGALGTQTVDTVRPVEVPHIRDAVAVAAGYANSACITASGDLYLWGDNTFCKSGGGRDVAVVTSPLKIDLGGKLAANCSLGSLYSAVVAQDGSVLTWGYGGAGNLGHGDRKNVAKPKVVQALDGVANITHVACTVGQINTITDPDQVAGKENPHTMFVAASGALYTCGTCHKGMLGNHTTKILSPPAADELTPYLVGSSPRDDPQQRPTEYLKDEACIQAASSSIHSAVLTQSGRVYSFGCASGGRMGVEQYMYGLHGGRSRMKCYVSKPTAIEAFLHKHLHVVGVSTGRRHMAAIAIERKEHLSR